MTRAAALWSLAAAFALLTAICALTIDEPIARALGAYEPSPLWNRGVAALEYAAGIEPWKWTSLVALGAGAVACIAWPAWRGALAAWLYVAGTYLLVRNLTSWIKLFTGRWRPNEWLAHGGGAMWRRDDAWSFPSGHVALIAGLVIPLAVVAPRFGRPLLAVVVFAMVARIAAGEHFVSDTLGAIALTCACAALWEPVLRRFR